MKVSLVLVVALLSCQSALFAAEFTAPITNLVPAATGDRLIGDFDFGVQFSEIHSFRFEFTLPDGFNGAATSTGNSSYYRSLIVIIHDPDESIEFTDSGPVSQSSTFEQCFYGLEPNEMGAFHMYPISGPGGLPSPDLKSKEFLMLGHGSVTITDFQSWTNHPLPEHITTSSTGTYSLPGPAALARITLSGITVPEPSSLVLLLASVASFASSKCHSTNRHCTRSLRA